MSAKPIPGQQVIDVGIERQPALARAETFRTQLSLSKVLTHEYQGLDLADFTEIGQAEIDAADPFKLRTGLIGSSVKDHPHAIRFDSFDAQTNRAYRETIALSAAEDDRVMRTDDPANYARRAYNSAMKQAVLLGDEKARVKAEGNALESVVSKHDRMAEYIDGTLRPEITRLTRFDEYARNFEKRRLQGRNFDIELTWLRQVIFGDMLTVIGTGREWSDQQRRVAGLAVDWRIFFDPQSRNRIRNFNAMNKLALEYYGLKLALFSDRKARASRYIRQQQR